MVLPGGPDFTVPLAIAHDDLRQLADHDATHRTFEAGPGTPAEAQLSHLVIHAQDVHQPLGVPRRPIRTTPGSCWPS